MVSHEHITIKPGQTKITIDPTRIEVTPRYVTQKIKLQTGASVIQLRPKPSTVKLAPAKQIINLTPTCNKMVISKGVGPRGVRGYSNYELWLQAGNAGTLDDYFSLLQTSADFPLWGFAGERDW